MKIIYEITKKQYFKNANQASVILGLDAPNLNRHLKGKGHTIKGYMLQVVDIDLTQNPEIVEQLKLNQIKLIEKKLGV